MNSLVKEVIEKLSNEKDNEILAVDFYEYIKCKKHKSLWENVQEVDTDKDEKVVCDQYQREEQKLVDFNGLVQKLGLDG